MLDSQCAIEQSGKEETCESIDNFNDVVELVVEEIETVEDAVDGMLDISETYVSQNDIEMQSTQEIIGFPSDDDFDDDQSYSDSVEDSNTESYDSDDYEYIEYLEIEAANKSNISENEIISEDEGNRLEKRLDDQMPVKETEKGNADLPKTDDEEIPRGIVG